jgi:hypothetical protein
MIKRIGERAAKTASLQQSNNFDYQKNRQQVLPIFFSEE